MSLTTILQKFKILWIFCKPNKTYAKNGDKNISTFSKHKQWYHSLASYKSKCFQNYNAFENLAINTATDQACNVQIILYLNETIKYPYLFLYFPLTMPIFGDQQAVNQPMKHSCNIHLENIKIWMLNMFLKPSLEIRYLFSLLEIKEKNDNTFYKNISIS